MPRSSKDPLERDIAAKLRLVYSISRLLSAAVDEKGVVARACELLANQWPYRLVAFVEALEDGTAYITARAGDLAESARLSTRPMRWDDAESAKTAVGTALRSGLTTTFRTSDVGPDELRRYLNEYGIIASAAMPVWVDDQRSALLVLTDNAEGFSAFELELLQGLGEDVAHTLEGLRVRNELFEERQNARTRLERLEALWDLASRQVDADAQIDAIVREGSRRLGLDAGALARLVGENVVFDVVSSHDQFHEPGEVLPANATLAGLAMCARRTLHTADVVDDPLYGGLQGPLARAARAVIAAPFEAGAEQLALVFAGAHPHAAFTAEDIAYIELLAAFCARVLQHREDVQQIAFLQNHDPLTKLPNRYNFSSRLHDAVERARRAGSQLAVLFIDLIRLREILDEFGAAISDRVFEELASRMALTAGPEDLLFRYGSEGFALLHTRWRSVAHIDALANALITTLEDPMVVGDTSYSIAAFVGLAIYPDDGAGHEDIEIAAETALRRAKREGRSGHRFYSSELDAHLAHRRMAALELRRAIEQHQLVLHYQPIVNVADGITIALEALVRWPHPDRGVLMPAHFIPLAEESDLILHLGNFVMHRAARAAYTFAQRGLRVPVAVNISAAQFAEPTFVHGVRAALVAAHVKPSMLELELTETVAMRDPNRTQALMHECRDMGLRIALDDFGTGHSSLAVLKRLPIDILKIDKSFVSGLPHGADDAAIARAVIALGKSLRCEVRAEGVETLEQAQWLREERCDSAQGYLYARPAPPESFGSPGREEPERDD